MRLLNESLINRGLLLLIIKGSHLIQVHHLREDVAYRLPSIQHVTSRVFIVVREQLRVLRGLQPFDHVLQLNQLVLDASFPTRRLLLIELGPWSLVSAALIIFLLLVLSPIRILVATQPAAVIVAIRVVVIDNVLVSHILYHNWLLLRQEQRMMAVKAK